MKKSKVKKELIMFVFITLGWSWLFWFAEIIWEINLYVAPFGPLVAALFLAYLKDDKKRYNQELVGYETTRKHLMIDYLRPLLPIILE